MVLNYPFVYSIFSWCAKGIVIIYYIAIQLFKFTKSSRKSWDLWVL